VDVLIGGDAETVRGRALLQVYPARCSGSREARYVTESVSLCWGLSRERAAEAALVASELFAGALAVVTGPVAGGVAGGEIEVTVRRVQKGLMIEVRHGCPDGDRDRGGWSAAIVQGLSVRHGQHRHDDGDRTVYAVVPAR
jgi:hypothetical protein